MKSVFKNSASWMLLVVLLSVSCKKTASETGVDVAPGETGNPVYPHGLEVPFKEGSIDLASVDSVVAEVTVITQGLDKKDTLKLVPSKQSFYTAEVAQGDNRRIRIWVYTRKQPGESIAHLFRLDTTVLNGALQMPAPTGTRTDRWTPCIFINDPFREVQVILPERMEESWMELRGRRDSPWGLAFIERVAIAQAKEIAYQDVWIDAEMAGKETVFENGNILQLYAFRDFSESMKSSDWERASYFVALYDYKNSGNDVTYTVNYGRRVPAFSSMTGTH